MLALICCFLTGCTSTQFSEYRGQAVFDGKGGSVHKVDGIDVWETGEPDCKYQVIGFIDQHTIQSGELIVHLLTSSASESQLIKEAKNHGGDAIIFVSSSSQILGASSQVNGNFITDGSNGTFQGNGSTYIHTSEQRQVAIVKYLK